MTGDGASPWVFTILGASTFGDPAGFDSMLLPVPDRWYGTVGGERCLLAPVAGKEMRALSEQGAAGIGERLHHAEWVITSDPEQVRQIGMTHDCADCLAGTETAVAWLESHPGGEIAAGLLYWADPDLRRARPT